MPKAKKIDLSTLLKKLPANGILLHKIGERRYQAGYCPIKTEGETPEDALASLYQEITGQRMEDEKKKRWWQK